MEPGRKTRSSVESVQSENREPTHAGDTTVLRDRQSKRPGERRTRKRGAMEVKGAEVSTHGQPCSGRVRSQED